MGVPQKEIYWPVQRLRNLQEVIVFFCQCQIEAANLKKICLCASVNETIWREDIWRSGRINHASLTSALIGCQCPASRHGHFIPWQRTCSPVGQEVMWAPEPVWITWGRNFFALPGLDLRPQLHRLRCRCSSDLCPRVEHDVCKWKWTHVGAMCWGEPSGL